MFTMFRSTAAQKEDRQFWLKWLERYKFFECLWKDEAKRETGKLERDAAYQELAQLIIDEGINENADTAYVRSRINAFRSNYRREIRRVKAAKKKRTDYKTQLFYYNALSFLNESSKTSYSKDASESEEEDSYPINISRHYEQRVRSNYDLPQTLDERTAAIKTKLDECFSNENYTSLDKTPKMSAITVSSRTAAKKRKFSDLSSSDDYESNHSIQNMVMPPLDGENDEYVILGTRIAAHFRSMAPHQRLLAEKIITDVCIYARMEKLTSNSAFHIDSIETAELIETSDDNPDTTR